MSSSALERGSAQPKWEESDLLVFGYACRLYPPDDKSEFIAEERHLQPWNGDGSLRIDRYDVRLLLSTIDDRRGHVNEGEFCPTEAMEEDMCQDERYRDMFIDIQKLAIEEEEEKKRKAEIAFDYGTSDQKSNLMEDIESDDEDEPFEPPLGVKLPLGLTLPPNQKQNHIIERTAMFVVSKGPQMEIVIKAKQRNNSEQFGFLEFDNTLYPYYKYISKLIREKKYTPDLNKRKKKDKSTVAQRLGPNSEPSTSIQNGKKTSNALAAIAAQHQSDSDSDSDCELHPSLLSRKRTPSPDIIERDADQSGPRRKPATPPPEPVSAIRADYDMNKSNDMYASLFKNLTKVSNEREEERQRAEEKKELAKSIAASAPPPPDEEWREWWKCFYGSECPYSGPQPMVPPPPDMEPVVASYASFIAQHGAEAESGLRDRPDLQLHFMHPSSPHFSYYQHRVRYAQWELAQQQPSTSESVQQLNGSSLIDTVGTTGTKVDSHGNRATSECGSPSSQLPSSNGVLNRKQRRRLQDAQKVGTAPPIFDPTASKPGLVVPVLAELPKIQSSPALLMTTSTTTKASASPSSSSVTLVSTAPKPYVPSTPVSFSLAPIKEEPKIVPTPLILGSDSLEDESETVIDTSTPPPPAPVPPVESDAALVSLPPVPPTMLNNTQLDRKEKARIFMEKLLNEKRAKKAKQVEEQRIKELERQKAQIEKQLSEAKSSPPQNEKRCSTVNPLSMIDDLINSRINNILHSTGIQVEGEKGEAGKDDEDSEDEERKRKKDKKKKHKHKHERKRSRSRSRDDRSKRRKRRSSSSTERKRSRRKE